MEAKGRLVEACCLKTMASLLVRPVALQYQYGVYQPCRVFVAATSRPDRMTLMQELLATTDDGKGETAPKLVSGL